MRSLKNSAKAGSSRISLEQTLVVSINTASKAPVARNGWGPFARVELDGLSKTHGNTPFYSLIRARLGRRTLTRKSRTSRPGAPPSYVLQEPRSTALSFSPVSTLIESLLSFSRDVFMGQTGDGGF